MENSMKFLKKLKIEPPYDPAIPRLNMYWTEIRFKKCMHPNVHHNTVNSGQSTEAT